MTIFLKLNSNALGFIIVFSVVRVAVFSVLIRSCCTCTTRLVVRCTIECTNKTGIARQAKRFLGKTDDG